MEKVLKELRKEKNLLHKLLYGKEYKTYYSSPHEAGYLEGSLNAYKHAIKLINDYIKNGEQ